MTKYGMLTAYRVTREYGGPEEGGWWYDWYELVDIPSRKLDKGSDVDAMRESFLNEFDKPEHPIWSVLNWEGEVRILLEDIRGEHVRDHRPHYE